MSPITKAVTNRLKNPKTQQWLWFVGLWCAGFLAVTVLTYPIKILIRFMK